MSFFGKKYKKVAAENMSEVLVALKVDEKVRKLFEGPESLTSFSKNEDGTIDHAVEVSGKKEFSQTLELGKEGDLTAPDGKKLKYIANLEGNVLKVTISSDEGKKVFLERVFDGDKFVMTIQPDGMDIKGTVTYQAV